MLSGSFCDPQGEQENGEVFRRVDTYVCASIHFSSTLRKNSDFFSIYSNVKTFRQRNCHEGRLVIKWNVQFQKISITPTPWNFHSRGACPAHSLELSSFYSWADDNCYTNYCASREKCSQPNSNKRSLMKNNVSFEISINSKLTNSLLINLTLSPGKSKLERPPSKPTELSLFRPPLPSEFPLPFVGGGGVVWMPTQCPQPTKNHQC